MQKQIRECNKPIPSFGGKPCDGEAELLVPCNNHTCSMDGNWAAWSSFGPCSKACGTGTRKRTRECKNPTPSSNTPNSIGGKSCVGDSEESADCNSFSCQDSSISWFYGDGIGGSEENIGQVAGREECVFKCSTRRQNGRLANGATLDAATETKCYCEFNQRGRSGGRRWINAYIGPIQRPVVNPVNLAEGALNFGVNLASQLKHQVLCTIFC